MNKEDELDQARLCAEYKKHVSETPDNWQEEREELVDALVWMVKLHCWCFGGGDYISSHGDSISAKAILLLEKYGKVEIEMSAGWKVLARWIEEDDGRA